MDPSCNRLHAQVQEEEEAENLTGDVKEEDPADVEAGPSSADAKADGGAAGEENEDPMSGVVHLAYLLLYDHVRLDSPS